ncbi:MAG: hypothetical protein J6V44_16280 [Methanobrevibacter sp.]|nr:hypothetical protein [Methanobrevibacter sp.]MBO7692041.1 hypothetical protein [Methanobrevibacter sp.]
MALSIPYVKYRPCLVQHLDIDTLVQKMTRNNRRTIYFKDYLDDLHITIDNATLHLYNLQKKFKEHFDMIEEAINKKPYTKPTITEEKVNLEDTVAASGEDIYDVRDIFK